MHRCTCFDTFCVKLTQICENCTNLLCKDPSWSKSQITNYKTDLHIISIIVPFFSYVKRAVLYRARVHITVLFLQGFLFEGNSQKQNIGETHRKKRWRLRGPYSDKCKMGNKIMGDSLEGVIFLCFVIMCFGHRNVKMCRAHKICVFEF